MSNSEVYVLGADGSDLHKIGQSKNVQQRVEALASGSPLPLF